MRSQKETVTKWIANKCKWFEIEKNKIRGMKYMYDEVRIPENDIWKMITIQTYFSTLIWMEFKIHKCAYWKCELVHDNRSEVMLENFNTCSDEILRFKGSEAFKYLGEYKPTPLWETSSKMHHLHIIFGKDTQKKNAPLSNIIWRWYILKLLKYKNYIM